MKNLLLAIFLFLFPVTGLFSQGTLFDDSRVSSVYIEIPSDSLAVIMTDVLSDHYFLATFIFDDGTGRDTLQDVGFRLRGNTSRYSQKKSFKVSFNEYVPGREYQGVKKINLNGQHNDPTMVREKLYYDVWKTAGLAERRTSFVRMYINHIYYGLYTNLEDLDKDWLQRIYGEKSGNLYKCTWPADLVYLGPDPQLYKNIQSGAATGGRAYDLQTNETADDYSDLVDLITLLNQPADSAFAVQIAQKINVDGFLTAFALDIASGNWDDYMYNKNNYYFYHRTDTDRFEFISYDTDNTFGVDWMGQDWGIRNCLDWYNHGESRPLAEKILSVPAFMAKYQRYLDTIAREIINPDILFPHIDSLEVLVTDAAVADTFRTLDYGYTVADFHNGFIQGIDAHTPYGIKSFLTTRYTSILQQLPAAAVPDEGTEIRSLSVYPNPADGFITLNASPSGDDRKGYILDMLGRQRQSFTLNGSKVGLTLSVADLTPGVYMLVLENNGSLVSRRFSKR
jgi:spore coat protein H